MVEASKKLVVGYIEKARIYPGSIELYAKLDTGADTSSLHVEEYEEFERDGKKWIRFTIDNKKKKPVVIEKELIRMSKIKRHRGRSQIRPVIKLRVCIGDVLKETKVNLYDRSRFKYDLLIGRNYMRGRFIVDPSLKRTSRPLCEEETDR